MTKEKTITTTTVTPFGPTGQIVYERTYSRPKPDGTKETYPETVERVATGNLALVYGQPSTWSADVQHEHDRLVHFMERFAILPAGRHLWATGVKGREFLFNCHVAPWGPKLSDHFEFTFMRLMEGGGVGANYSTRFLQGYGSPRRSLEVHIVCDRDHADYAEMEALGVLSKEYDADWDGAFDVDDSREGWASALVDLVDTYMTDDVVLHQKRVYDVSRVRKRGSRLKTFGGTASGPAPFATMMVDVAKVLNNVAARSGYGILPTDAMDIDHAIASCVVAGGNRRSARMAGVHWKDPSIFDFINSKANGGKNWTTNISVIIDDEFLAAVDGDVHGYPGRNEWAYSVHQAVVKGMLTNGEPGYWNVDLSNEGEVNEVVITNPCGEIALPERGACVLGHVNLDAFAPVKQGGPADTLGLVEAHRLMTRFLIRATYGDMSDAGQKAVMDSERRIGVGHFGVQGFLAKRGIRYSQAPKGTRVANLLIDMKAVVRKEARSYAFELRIPEPVKVTTVAPTGTIAKLPGATEGIHPIYARTFIRRVRFSLADPDQAVQVEAAREQGFEVEKCVYDGSGNTAVVAFPTLDNLVAEVVALGYPADIVESADEISLEDMLAFQAMYQRWYADNAVSYTVNVPAQPHQAEAMLEGREVPAPSAAYVAKVSASLLLALPRLKGTTLMVDGSRKQAPYERITRAEYDAAQATLVSDGIDEDCSTGACPVR